MTRPETELAEALRERLKIISDEAVHRCDFERLRATNTHANVIQTIDEGFEIGQVQ